MLLYTLFTLAYSMYDYWQCYYTKHVSNPYRDVCKKLYSNRIMSVVEYDIVKYRKRTLCNISFCERAWDLFWYLTFDVVPIGPKIFVPKYDTNMIYDIQIWTGSKCFTQCVFDINRVASCDKLGSCTEGIDDGSFDSHSFGIELIRRKPFVLVTINDHFDITGLVNDHHNSIGLLTADELIAIACLNNRSLSCYHIVKKKIQFYTRDKNMKVLTYEGADHLVGFDSCPTK